MDKKPRENRKTETKQADLKCEACGKPAEVLYKAVGKWFCWKDLMKQ